MKNSVFLIAPKSWDMLLEYRLETRSITKDNTIVIPNFSVSQWVRLQAHYLHIQIRGEKQLIFTAARVQHSTENFHKSVYWFQR